MRTMPKRKGTIRGQALTLLRRSSASGVMGKKRKDRQNARIKAIKEDIRAE